MTSTGATSPAAQRREQEHLFQVDVAAQGRDRPHQGLAIPLPGWRSAGERLDPLLASRCSRSSAAISDSVPVSLLDVNSKYARICTKEAEHDQTGRSSRLAGLAVKSQALAHTVTFEMTELDDVTAPRAANGVASAGMENAGTAAPGQIRYTMWSVFRSNTVACFSLNDYEWVIALEADEPRRIVDLMRHLRGAEPLRRTRAEVPVFTECRKAAHELVTAQS